MNRARHARRSRELLTPMQIQHRIVGDVAILDLNGELKLGDEGLRYS